MLLQVEVYWHTRRISGSTIMMLYKQTYLLTYLLNAIKFGMVSRPILSTNAMYTVSPFVS